MKDKRRYTNALFSEAKLVVELLQEQKRTLSVAESFTGGAVSNSIVLVEGASSVFYEGIVSYNSHSKIDRLGVKSSTLERYGAVSAEVAEEMAAGLLKTGKADVAVATTGIAGRATDDRNTPVGQAFIACGIKRHIKVYEFFFEGNRKEIIQAGTFAALNYLYRYLAKERW